MESQTELTPEFVIQEYKEFFIGLLLEIKQEEHDGCKKVCRQESPDYS
jgi:hypothetical protein